MGKRGEKLGLETIELPDILLNGEEILCHICQPMPSEFKANLSFYCWRATGTFSGSAEYYPQCLGQFSTTVIILCQHNFPWNHSWRRYFSLPPPNKSVLWNGGAAVFHPRHGYISLVVELISKCVQLATHLESFLEQKTFCKYKVVCTK